MVMKTIPLYAPSIVKAWLHANEWRLVTAETVARATHLELRQVQAILQRMHKDGEIHIRISAWRRKTFYYWVESPRRQPVNSEVVTDERR